MSHSTEHPPYITVYESIGGWKAVFVAWTSDPDFGGYYEPYQTGCGAYATTEEAEKEAKWWAKDEKVEYHQPSSKEG